MYKVDTKHLEQLRKALHHSNKALANIPPTMENESGIKSAMRENEKAIQMINDEYLEIKA